MEFPPVDPKNLVRLAEDFLQAYSALCQLVPPDYSVVSRGRIYISSISGLISKGGVSPTNLFPTEAAALAETLRKVSFPRWIFLWFLTLLVGRPYRPYQSPATRTPSPLPRATCGSDSIPTPSSVNRESSRTWNFVMNARPMWLLDSRISGREIIMRSRYA